MNLLFTTPLFFVYKTRPYQNIDVQIVPKKTKTNKLKEAEIQMNWFKTKKANISVLPRLITESVCKHKKYSLIDLN